MGAVAASIRQKNEDENCTSSFSSSTIPLTSGIEEAPQLLLSVIYFYHIPAFTCKTRLFHQSLLLRPLRICHAPELVSAIVADQ